MNVITNKQWQKQQQQQSRLTLSQKYLDREFTVKPRLLSQRDLRTTEKVIKNKVDRKKKGKAITALPILFQTNDETVF